MYISIEICITIIFINSISGKYQGNQYGDKNSVKKEDSENSEDYYIQAIVKALHDEIQQKIESEKQIKNYKSKIKDSDNLQFEIKKNTILDFTSSKASGFLLINKANVYDINECIKNCHNTINCTVSIFQEQKPKDCYLLDCGTPLVCKFKSQADFSTIVFNKKSEPRSYATTTTSTTTPTTTTTTHAPIIKIQTKQTKKSYVELFGICIANVSECSTANSYCANNICMCRRGYVHQGGECRKRCGHFEYQCENVQAPLATPQCIAIYDKCDGMAQCSDASDEAFCHQNKVLHNGRRTMPLFPTAVSTIGVNTKLSSKVTSPTKTTTTTTITMKGLSGSKVALSTLSTTPTSPPSEKISPKNQGKGENSPKGQVHLKSLVNPVSNKTAVIALSLGLLITAFLLLIVGCRLRMVKQRLRKGRPINAKEADYLINGMYL